MAAGAVELSPLLRPWRENGVEFLLADAPVPAPYSLCLEASVVSSQSRLRYPVGAACEAAEGQVVGVGKRLFAPEAARDAKNPPLWRARECVAPSTEYSSQAPPAETVSSPSGAEPAVRSLLPPDHWPAVWRERFAATRPAVVLWTYWALGEDLCLKPDAARRDLFRRLLADLGHPAGTHSFWPAALPGAEGLKADCQVFWSGVDMLKARALVVMGSPAVKALGLPARLRPFQQTRHNGRMVVVLRDVDFLVEETHRYDAVREFLRQALAPFARS